MAQHERRAIARRIAEESGQHLPETASLWAYFVLRALAFFRPRGRMVMLVPESILQADYAANVRNALVQRFDKVKLVHLRQRLFDGTDETVVVIAAEGFGGVGNLEVHSVETATELNALMNGLVRLHLGETLPNGRRISSAALSAMGAVESSPRIARFGDLAKTRIGIVTGCNHHFIRSLDELRELSVPVGARVPILARTKLLSGLEFTDDDHCAIVNSGARAYLVRPTRSVESIPGVVRWIEDGRRAGVHQRYKCREREPWYRVGLPPKPDAFVTSTRLGSPRLVLNRGEFQCTNTLYAAYWQHTRTSEPKVIALGFLTTFAALWSEINGRRYGGGVLKLDLTALGELPIPVVSKSVRVFEQVDAALRGGDETRARLLADDAVLRRGLGVSESHLDYMREALVDLMRQRAPSGENS